MEDDQRGRDEPPAKETAEFPRPAAADETSVLPAAQEPGQPPARWSARAGIPVRNREPEPGWVREEGPPRTWWAPIVIVVAIVVLLGLISLGLWLALKGQPTPVPSPSVVPSSAASSASPTPSPTPTASSAPTVTLVPVPVLAGATVNDAQQALQAQGLNWTVVNRVSDQPAGTVVDTDPPAGTQVPAGTEVTLFVATPPPSSANPNPSNP